MACRLTELVLDSHDPERLASFWCEVLGYVVLERVGDDVEIGPADVGFGGPQPTIVFNRTAESKQGKLRLHIDVSPTDREQDAELSRLLAAGATRVDIGQTGEESWHVLGSGRKRVLLAPPTRHFSLTSSCHSRQAGQHRYGPALPELDQISSIHKAAVLLGIGRANVASVATDGRLRMDVVDLLRQIGRDRRTGSDPFCVVATAGSVLTGAVDPLAEIAEVAAEHGLWMHVDACYGGFARLARRCTGCSTGCPRRTRSPWTRTSGSTCRPTAAACCTGIRPRSWARSPWTWTTPGCCNRTRPRRTRSGTTGRS